MSFERGLISFLPSVSMPRATYTDLLIIRLSCLTLTTRRSKNTIGYIRSKGRLCQARTSSIIQFVTLLIGDSLTSASYNS